jgi:hypothetical protein
VIREYLKRFRAAFGDLFQYVSVSYAGPDGRKVLLALVPADRFAQRFETIDTKFVDLLNSADRPDLPSEQEAREQLAQWFGRGVTRTLSADRLVDQALTDPAVWFGDFTLDDTVAVVDAQGRLNAATTRRKIIQGLLESRPE